MSKNDNINQLNENNKKINHLTEKEVLKVAARLISNYGYHGTSTQMIADALGVSKSTLFHHIKNKQQMLFEILREPTRKIFPDLKEIYSRELTPTEKIKLVIRNHIFNLIENIEVVGVLLQERKYLEEPYEEILVPVREEYVRIFCKIIEDGIDSGEFRNQDVKMAAFAIFGMLNWLAQWYNVEGKNSPEEIAELYTDYALRILN